MEARSNSSIADSKGVVVVVVVVVVVLLLLVFSDFVVVGEKE